MKYKHFILTSTFSTTAIFWRRCYLEMFKFAVNLIQFVENAFDNSIIIYFSFINSIKYFEDIIVFLSVNTTILNKFITIIEGYEIIILPFFYLQGFFVSVIFCFLNSEVRNWLFVKLATIHVSLSLILHSFHYLPISQTYPR